MIKETFYDFYNYNQKLFILVNQWTHDSHLTPLLEKISSLFFIGLFPVYYFAAVLICYIALKYYHKKPEPTFHKYYNILVTLGCVYAMFGFAYAALKFGINLPRPFCSLNPNLFYSTLDFTNERCLSSFPSAHTGLSVIICYFLWPYLKSITLKAIAIAAVTCVGLARIALAMHYPSDILYSVIIAMIIIKGTEYILRNQHIQKLNQWVSRTLFRILF